jgi:hypothetical protein
MPDPVCASGRASINRIVGLGAVASRRPALVLAVLAVVTIAGAYEGLQLEARYDFRDFLPMASRKHAHSEHTSTTVLV